MSQLVKLDAGYQNYAWGKDAASSFVAKMKGKTDDTSGKYYAELWVGTHPSCPSKLADGNHELLDDYLKSEAAQKIFFSPSHQSSRFKGTVPYLLKILSIRTALSIQAHPSKQLAERLHAERPDKYKDPNHKPELICALTAFEALCCFRPLEQVIAFLKMILPLRQLVAADAVLGNLITDASAVMPASDSAAEKEALKKLMEQLYAAPEADCTAALKQNRKKLQREGPMCVEDEIFLRLYDQYPNDVGCWMIYFLNYVQMTPGQALFLSDSEPHAYISGDGVEIMACSDNVVRAGLTPKWKDVATLLSMLKYSTTGLISARHERKRSKPSSWEVQYYQPPSTFPDFSLYRLQNDDTSLTAVATVDLPTIGLGFCLEGSAMINGTAVKAGECFAVPYGKMTCGAIKGEKALVFVASTNSLSKCSL